MLYLVIGETTGGPPPGMSPQQAAQLLDTVVVPSLEMLAKWERDGRIHGGSFVGRRGARPTAPAAKPAEKIGCPRPSCL
jgi:hypothetical protein